MHGVLVFAWQDAVTVTEALDPGKHRGLSAVATDGLVVEADSVRCPGRLDDASPAGGDGFTFTVTFECPSRPAALRVSLPLLRALPPEHRHLVRIESAGGGTESTLTPERVVLEAPLAALPVPIAEGTAPGVAPSRAPSTSFAGTLRSALPLGIFHILAGWDHLLFLLALALGVPGARGAILPVTAFTVAHSITLALAALSIFVLSPRIVEPLIALSIAVVAFENAFRDAPARRTAVTFAFGLVHGFGFAGTLRDLALDGGRLVPTLLGFNVGVEVGQIAALLVLVPLASTVRRPGRAGWSLRANLCVGAVGAVLFVARVVGTPPP